jgi:hypothetical protein
LETTDLDVRIGWAWGTRNVYTILVGKPLGKRRTKLENKIRMTLKHMHCEVWSSTRMNVRSVDPLCFLICYAIH